ncbi:MAG: N-6 DNA methylase [Verrucomicrobiae bacterium]|nr:N-6 DNA methylase [Verrucomicrobiae bacterium]
MRRSADSFYPAGWLKNSTAVALYRSEHEWAADPLARNSAHLIRRAWRNLELEAVLTVENKPTVYFKRVTKKDPAAEAEFHRLLWNQGTATLLVVRDSAEVRVYSALALPDQKPIADGEDDPRLVDTLRHIQSALELTDFIRRVETGRIYQEARKRDRFHSENGVDRTLLRYLKLASKRLCSGDDPLKPSVAHALLGRLLFTCYLRARGVLSNHYLKREAGVNLDTKADKADNPSPSIQEIIKEGSPTQAKETLFKIFKAVKGDFNGSLFGEELEGESRAVHAAHMDVLRDFLNGEDAGQQSFGFPVYDFRLIPVETISAIYESFLRNESQTLQSQTGSFYTPRHLAELTVDLATEGWPTLLDKKCCDPSAGSGIFLVILFNRMAEEWRFENPRKSNVERARALRELLCKNFWGVDLNVTACRITCFSLYLALFDQLEPADIWQLKKELEREQGEQKVLPPLLAESGKDFKGSETPRVLEANFFRPDLPLPTDFHLVIGNPPWIGRGQERDAEMEQWFDSKENPYLADAPKSAAARRAYFFPERQSAHGFMWKVPAHLRADGRACLVLPTKVFMNERTNAFQAGWMNRFSLDHVIQLADYSFLIFEEADCPAVIARFTPHKPADQAVVLYDTPKVERTDPRHSLITVLPDDQKGLRLHELLLGAQNKCASVVWKQALWGTGRDVAFLHRLYRLPTLGDVAGDPDDETKRWAKGQGFQPFSEKRFKEDPKKYLRNVRLDTKPWWKSGQRLLEAENDQISLVVCEDDAPPQAEIPSRLRRSFDEKLAQPPMVLVTQGFGKAAFCNFSVVFEHSIQSIAAKQRGDDDLLRFLAAVVTSSFAKYFLFHTAANWGSERDKVHLTELLRLPFPLPKDCRDQTAAERIVSAVAKRVREAHTRIAKAPLNFERRKDEITDAKRDIEPLVFEYFGVTATEKILIEDTLKWFIPSSTPGSLDGDIPTLDDSRAEERAAYAKQLCQTLNTWGRGKGLSLSAQGRIAEKFGLGLLILTKGKIKTSYRETEAQTEVAEAIADIEKAITVEHRKLAYARGFTLFEPNRALVLKPLARRHWTRTAALNDADAIFAAMFETAPHPA